MAEVIDETVTGKCPVCGRELPEKGRLRAEYDAQNYWLCSEGCRKAFLDAPARFVGNTAS
ncbi:MAG: YHS domain-containing protein [Propionibacterium sp.]